MKTARSFKTLSLLGLSSIVLALAAVGCGESSDTTGLAGTNDNRNASPPPANNNGSSGNVGNNAGGNNNSQGAAERAIAEADVVQLADGRLYAMSKSGTLSIVDVSRPGRLAMLGQAYLPGEPFEMYLRGDLLVAMTNGAYTVSGQTNEPARPSSTGASSSGQQGGAPASSSTSPTSRDVTTGAGVIVINVKDPGLMQRVATFPVAGEIADSRVIGNILYLATYQNGNCYQCGVGNRTMVTSFDIAAPTTMRQVDQISFDAGNMTGWQPNAWKRSVFATTEHLYVGGHEDFAVGKNGQAREGGIDVIDITDTTGKLRRGEHITTTGAILSRWQMDEHNGVLRVVSQRGAGYATNGIGNPEVQTFQVWNAAALQEMGTLSMRMPRQEALKSVRFDGDRAYAITFAETDPLFVLDLKDPAKPAQRGELVMPGWVFHLEPHGDRVLGLGLDRRNSSGHLNVSLFDVSNMDAPKMLTRVNFGAQTGTSTDANIVSYELPEDQDRIQKAFRVLNQDLIVVPFSGRQIYANSAGYNAANCGTEGGGVQLIEWKQDALIKQATLPVAGHPRRALLNQGEILAVSDSNVTSFDIGRRDVALQTADLVIGTCESRTAPANGTQTTFTPTATEGGWNEEGGDGVWRACSASSTGTPAKSGGLGGLVLGLAALVVARRRQKRIAA